MHASSKPRSSADLIRNFRAYQRAKSMRLVRFWLPDVNSQECKKEAHRQSGLVANSRDVKEDQTFIDSISVLFQDDE